MSRGPRIAGRVLALALVAGGLWAGARRLWPTASAGARQVPTFEVKEDAFVRRVAADGVLKPVKTTVLSAPSEGREALMIAFMAEDGDPVKKGDVVIRFDNGELSRKLADGEADRAVAEGRMERERTVSQTSMKERDRAAAMTGEELARTRELGRKDPRFFSRSEVIESEIDEGLYTSRLEHARRARKIEEQLARSKLDLLGIERHKAELVRRQAAATLKELEIRAPHDGTFVLQRWGNRGVLRAGDRVYPGMRIAEISTSERMDAEVFVLEADAGGLQARQRADVVLEARPDVVWKARVKQVDPFPKQRRPEVPAQYFTTLLEIEGNTAGLKPGQRLHATITLEEQAKALVVPRQAVFRRDDQTVVYRRAAGGAFEPTRVKLGPGTVGRLVIADGVEAGDQIALRDPTVSADEAVAARGGKGGARGAAPAAASVPSGPGGALRSGLR